MKSGTTKQASALAGRNGVNDKYDDAGILIRPIVKWESDMETENEQLRTRLCEMAAEIERLTTESARLRSDIEESRKALNAEIILSDSRAEHVKQLQSVIDEANAQDPVYFWREIGESDWMQCHKDWYYKCVDSAEHDTKMLYTHPIPAQQSIEQAHMAGQADAGIDPSYSNAQAYAISVGAQQSPAVGISKMETAAISPAVAVPDNFNGDDRKLIECATALLELDAKGVLIPHGLGGHAGTIIESFVARASKPSPRITEQDAREIAVSIFGYVGIGNFTAAFNSWFNDMGGRALLDKLNKAK